MNSNPIVYKQVHDLNRIIESIQVFEIYHYALSLAIAFLNKLDRSKSSVQRLGVIASKSEES